MTIVPKRIAVKFNLKHQPAIEPKAIVPIFQRWIQQHTVEGMLIDVIDYKHVIQGPGIMLIADEGDYGYDLADGQVGLQYTRKRSLPDNLHDALHLVLRLAFIAAQRLEDEGLDGIAFDYSAATIKFIDRRLYQNQPTTFESVQEPIIRLLGEIYDTPITLTRAYDDPREVFAVHYQTATTTDISILENHFQIQEQV